jgi:OOP family OmpA-OmpF porin
MKATKSKRIGLRTPARLSLLALALITSQLTIAADAPWYIGASAGQSRAEVDEDRIIARLKDDGFTSATLTEFEKSVGYKLFVGRQFNDNFAIEAGYFTLGEFGYMSELSPRATSRGSARMMGLNIDLVGTLPITEKFSAIGRIGAIYSQTRDQFSGEGPIIINPFQTREREASYKFGAGLQYDFSPALAFRLEAERYRVDDAIGSDGDIDLFSVGVVYRFGSKAVAASPAPTPTPTVAAAPRPTPTPAPTPPPAPTRVTLMADSMFDFNSAVIKPAGRTELDALANGLRGVDFDTVQVTGHTDRIGSQAYNQRLSTERANAVRDYLVMSATIAPNQVSSRGVASTQPVTTPAQCGNNLARPQLIVCLAPDRRVEVEVSGTRPR